MIIVAIIVASIGGGIGGHFLSDYVYYKSRKHDKIKRIISFWVAFVPIFIILTLATLSMGNADVEAFIKEYETTQEIYISSLDDERLTGFERIELVKMANESSTELARRQVDIYKWWNFGMNENLKKELCELKIIK